MLKQRKGATSSFTRQEEAPPAAEGEDPVAPPPPRDYELRIGAVEEGIFRNHMGMFDGWYRHSAYYSVIADEWPDVKQSLTDRLAQ